jgi:hypothetical protein
VEFNQMLRRNLLLAGACFALVSVLVLPAAAQAPAPPATQAKPQFNQVPLQPGTYNYVARIMTGTVPVDIAIITEIKADQDGWIAGDSASTLGGNVIDRTLLDKTTLAVRKRQIVQGPITIELTMQDGKVTGQAIVNGQIQSINVDAGGELYADGAGAQQVIATLPLAEGYTTSFRNLDVRTLKVRVMELRVVGSEQVTVPAGMFDTFKVEMVSPIDGAKTTLFIAKEGRKVVKVVQSSQLGGATVTSELQK